jgi:hypothetical protein
MKPSALAQSLAASKDRLQEMAHVLKMDMRKIDLTGAIPPQGRQEEALPKTAAREKESLAAPPEEARKAAPSPKAGEEAAPSPKAGPDAVSPKVGAEEAEDFKRLQFLYQVLEEVNQAIVSKVPINQILLMVLEGIFRGISFDRVIFSLVNVKRTHIGARFGLGEGIEELLPLMRAPLQSKTHALSLALAEDQDYMIDLEAQPQDRLLMEEEFWRASGVRSFLISPILVDQKAIGSVYVDRRHSRLPITETDRLRMRIFRDQLIIAIRLSSSQI